MLEHSLSAQRDRQQYLGKKTTSYLKKNRELQQKSKKERLKFALILIRKKHHPPLIAVDQDDDLSLRGVLVPTIQLPHGVQFITTFEHHSRLIQQNQTHQQLF